MTVYQVVMNQTVANKYCANVTYWDIPDDSTPSLQQFANEIRAKWLPMATAHLSDMWSLDNLTLRPIDGNPPFSFLQTFSLGPLNGQDLADLYDTRSALLVSTGYTGPRPNRGRIYFAGMTENGAENSVWGATPVNDIQTMVEDWANGVQNGLTLAFLRIVRWDKFTNTVLLNHPVDSVTGRFHPASVRNRRLAPS